MSATILAFPRSVQLWAPCASSTTGGFLRASSPHQRLDRACRSADFLSLGHRLAEPFSSTWCEWHLPLIGAAMDLLSADDAEFMQRCRPMQDEKGQAMLDELAGQLERLGTQYRRRRRCAGADGGEDPRLHARARLIRSRRADRSTTG